MYQKRLLLLLFLPLLGFSLKAQSNEALLNLLQQRGVITQQEADSLKRTPQKRDLTPATASDLSQEESETKESPKNKPFKPSVKVSGVGHVAFQIDERNGIWSNTFSLVRVCGIVNAQVLPKVRLAGLFYFNPAALQYMHEFYGVYSICPEFEIAAGLKKVPLTLANQLSPGNIETINPPLMIRNVVGGAIDIGNGINTGRDLGIEFRGNLFPVETHRLLEYRVGLFNGNGAKAVWNGRDNDNNKDLIAWAFFQPIKGWLIGGSTLQTLRLGYSKTPINRTIWNASTEYNSRFCKIRVEYINGKDFPADNQGINVLALWKITPHIDALLSYDFYQHQRVLGGYNEEAEYMAGVNIRFNTMCRLQTFYIYGKNRGSNPCEKQTFITQLQLGF